MRYVIDSRYYRGSTVVSMHDGLHNDNDKRETLKGIRNRHNNPHLIDITPERLELMNRRYRESIITPFREITEGRFHELLNCLPPLRMNRYSFFAGGEIYDDLYLFCFTANRKYYCGERSIRLSAEELIRLINEHTNKLNYHPALVKGEPYNQYFRWYNREVKRTPYYFIDGQQRKTIISLSSDTGNTYDDKQNRQKMTGYLRSLRSNCYQYLTFYANDTNIFDFFAWLRKNDYTLEVQENLFYFEENREFADFQGNVWEYSAAFYYRIYTREMLQHVINQLRTVKRKRAWN